MNAIERKRFEDLAQFLDELPPERFDFSDVYRDPPCGAVACAIGWTPKLFPELVRWNPGGWVEMQNGQTSAYDRVGALLFGIKLGVANMLFSPADEEKEPLHDSLPELGDDAAPSEVASMMRQFLSLVDAGEITI